MRAKWLGLLILTGCSPDVAVVEAQNVPPAVAINSPNVDTAFYANELISFAGIVSDDNGLSDIQSVSWVSSLDGPIGDELLIQPDSQGMSRFETILSDGSHAVTFSATDFAGETASDTVVVSVGFLDATPEVTILSPDNLDTVVAGDAFDLEGFATDPQYGPTELEAVWTAEHQTTGAVTDLLAENLDADGTTEGEWVTSEIGAFKLALQVTNPGGDADFDEILVVVTDPSLEDMDGDGQSPAAGDCDDTDPLIYTGAPELADGIDNDCDGTADEGTVLYDDDGDGFCESETTPCTDGTLNGDCDDDAYPVNPDADEVCGDSIDNDCDTLHDTENADGCVDYYYDFDGDTWGQSVTQPERCLCHTDGYWTAIRDGDCDDADGNIHPNQAELPNGIDDDCDSVADEGTPRFDADGDGYCPDPTQCTGNGIQPGDCNDSDASIHPNQSEVCGNGVDDNCNTIQNEQDASGCTWFYRDSDGDGYGHETAKQCWCSASGDYDVTSPANTDCLDSNSNVNPGHTAFESTAYWTGSAWSYDYNCDGQATKYYSSSPSYWCSEEVVDCSYGNGWVGTGPTCGETRNWGSGCYWVPFVSCEPYAQTPYTQTCR